MGLGRYKLRFAHLADLHLGRKVSGNVDSDFVKSRFNDFFEAFLKATHIITDQKVDFLIISGDIFDKSDLEPTILSKTTEILNLYKENNIPVFVVEGNHDSFRFQEKTWLEWLQEEGYLILLDAGISEEGIQFNAYNHTEKNGCLYALENNIIIAGIKYKGIENMKYLQAFQEYLNESKDEKQVILIMHTAFTSAQEFFPGFLTKEAYSYLHPSIKYFAGGHQHKALLKTDEQTGTVIAIPGSLECWRDNEYSQQNYPKYIYIVDTNHWSVEKIPSPKRKSDLFQLEIKETQINPENLLEDQIINFINNEISSSIDEDGIYYLDLKVPKIIEFEIDLTKLKNSLKSKFNTLSWKVLIRGESEDETGKVLPEDGKDSLKEIAFEILKEEELFQGLADEKKKEVFDLFLILPEKKQTSDLNDVIDQLIEDIL